MKLLESKVAIITGGSRGIGKSICETFAQNGCNVAFTYNNSKESAENLSKELNKLGVKAKSYKSDASNFNDATKLVEDVLNDFVYRVSDNDKTNRATKKRRFELVSELLDHLSLSSSSTLLSDKAQSLPFGRGGWFYVNNYNFQLLYYNYLSPIDHNHYYMNLNSKALKEYLAY